MALSGPQWAQADALLDRVLEIEPGERRDFLDHLSASDADPEAVDRVRQMLPGLETESGPLDRPVGELLGDAFIAGGGEPDAWAVGRHLGPYRIEAVLGRGGMGRVFAATRDDGEFSQEVAIKLLRWEFADRRAVARFLAERQLLATLDHPGIARLIDGGLTESGLPYLVMERVSGTTIDRYCEAQALSLTERVKLVRDVCQVVEHAHRNLVVHRDLKPSNIMVTDSGDVKLLDFGIAKILQEESGLTRDDQVPLTPNYGAPEQIRGTAITPATDVYALGVVLHELLTGIRPHEADHPPTAELARRVASEDPPFPSLSASASGRISEARQLRGDLDSIILKSLSREPGRRYSSAARLAEDLDRYLQKRPVQAVQAGKVYRLDRFVRRNRMAVGGAVILVLSLAVGLVSTLVQAERARAESHRARLEAERASTVSDMLVDIFGLADPFAFGGPIQPTDLLRRGVSEARSRLADDPLTLAALLTELGSGFTDLGEYDDAHPVLEEAVDLARSAGAPDVLAWALATHGGLELGRRRYDAAGTLLEEALVHQEAVGPGRRLASILGGLSRQRTWSGDPEGGLVFLDSAVSVYSAWDPDNHRARLRAEAFRGPILRLMGDQAGAAASYEAVLAEARSTLPPSDQLITSTLNNLAYLRKQMGDQEGAEAAYREALVLLETQVGPGHPDAVRVRTNLSAVLGQDSAGYQEAEALLARNVELLRAEGPAGLTRLERALTALIGGYLTWSMPERAEAAAREAIALAGDLPFDGSTIETMHRLRLSLAIRQQGREREARALFDDATGALRAGGSLNPSGRGTLGWLAGFFERSGFTDSAAALRGLIAELTPGAA